MRRHWRMTGRAAVATPPAAVWERLTVQDPTAAIGDTSDGPVNLGLRFEVTAPFRVHGVALILPSVVPSAISVHLWTDGDVRLATSGPAAAPAGGPLELVYVPFQDPVDMTPHVTVTASYWTADTYSAAVPGAFPASPTIAPWADPQVCRWGYGFDPYRPTSGTSASYCLTPYGVPL